MYLEIYLLLNKPKKKTLLINKAEESMLQSETKNKNTNIIEPPKAPTTKIVIDKSNPNKIESEDPSPHSESEQTLNLL